MSLASFTTALGTDQRISQSVAYVAPTVIALSETALIAAFLQASGALRQYTIVQTLLEPALRFTALIALVLVSTSWLAPIWSYTISILLTFVVGLALIRNDVQSPIHRIDWTDGYRGLAYSLPVMLAFALQYATIFVNVAIVNRLASVQAAGIFSAAVRVSMLCLWAQLAFCAPLLPLIANALEHDRAQLRSLYQRMVRFVMFVNVPLLAALFVGRTAVMELFGKEFVIGATALAWMVAGQLINTATAAIETMLPLGGKPTLGLTNNIFQLLGNVVLAWWLVPQVGVTGAGLAVGVSVIITNCIRTYQVWHRWGVSPFSRGLLLTVACGALVVSVWELVLKPRLPNIGVVGGLTSAALVGTFLFAACILVTAPDDRALLYGLLTGAQSGRTSNRQ